MDLSKCKIEIIKTRDDLVEKRWILYTEEVKPVIVKVETYTKAQMKNLILKIEGEKIEWQNTVVNDEITKRDDILNELTNIETMLNNNTN